MRLHYGLRVGMFMLGLTILMFSIMELVFAPLLSINYFLPSLIRNGSSNWTVSFFYGLLLMIELFNFLACLVLLVNIFLTGYFDKYCSYDLFTLISSAMSLSIIVHDILLGSDFYENCVERDIYIQAARIGSVRCRRNRRCLETDVSRWHQISQCCGWDSVDNLLNLYHPNQSNYLPAFCCPYAELLPSKQGLWNQNDLLCKLDNPIRFNTTCNIYREKFILMKWITIFGHPELLWYNMLKVSFAYAYALARKHSLLPQSEGAFSMRIPP